MAGKKRKMPLPPETTTVPAVPDTTSDTITKRPRAEPQEQPPAHSGPVSPEASHEGCVDDEQLPLLLDPVYSWIDDLDPIGVATTDSDAFLAFPVVDAPFAMISQPRPLPSSLNAASPPPPQPPLPLSLPTQQPQQPPIPLVSCDDAYPPLPSPSFEFRDGFDHEYDGFDAEDGHDHDHDHDCTCSSPHSSSSSLSGDAADAQLVKSLFGMMTDQVGELKKANEDLRESIDTIWQTFNERMDRGEKRVSELSHLVSTRLEPAGNWGAAFTPPSSSLADEPAPSQNHPRPELFRELPFLLDWADDIDFANPDGFVIDDLSKPFIVRRLFEPTQDAAQSLPVSIYASPAFCSFVRTAPHEIVGTLCYKAQDEPLRWFLAKKCPRPVGDLCFLPLVRPIGGRMVQSLTKNQLFYDRNGIAKLWILVVERFVGPMEEPAALSVSASCPQPREETCEGQHRKAEQSTNAKVS